MNKHISRIRPSKRSKVSCNGCCHCMISLVWLSEVNLGALDTMRRSCCRATVSSSVPWPFLDHRGLRLASRRTNPSPSARARAFGARASDSWTPPRGWTWAGLQLTCLRQAPKEREGKEKEERMRKRAPQGDGTAHIQMLSNPRVPKIMLEGGLCRERGDQ